MAHVFLFSAAVMYSFTLLCRIGLVFLAGCLACPVFAQSPELTSVRGKVIDARSEDGLPYASVQFEGEQLGARTDINGNFYLESAGKPKKVLVSYVGYQTASVDIKTGRRNEISVRLAEGNVDIKEITIRPQEYRRRNNPAVDLIGEVFRHKDANRKEGLDYYSYEQYEKLQFSLNGITDKFRRRWYLRKFQLIFNYADTNRVDGKVALPLYLRERLINVYYRKNPPSGKEYLLAETQTGLREDYDVDEDGVSAYLNNMYQDVDIYEPTIMLLNTQFIGPLSGAAPTFYRFYIVDTVDIDGTKYADVFFAPKNKNDQAFMGNLLVALDSSYAVRKVEMGISKEINLNWITALHLEQEFEFFGEGPNRRLLRVKDAVTMDFNILKKAEGRSLLARKTVSYKNYSLNQPLPDSLFKTAALLIRDTVMVKEGDSLRMVEGRHSPLTRQEQGISDMIDSIQNVRAFKRMVAVSRLLGTGYQKFGWLEIGPIATFYSFNDIEGSRFRIGGRTNSKLVKNMLLEGYTAYGLQDRGWKYYGAVTYAFKQGKPRGFPMNQITFSYQRDLRILGLELDNWQQDNFFLSAQRGANDRMVSDQVFRSEYMREFRSGFSYNLAFQYRGIKPAGALRSGQDTPGNFNFLLNTCETGFGLRYAPNEKFYQGKAYRLRMLTKFPIFSLSFRTSFKGLLGATYNYQRVSANIRKTFFVAPFGRSDWTLEAGGIFGTVSYPLLEIHRANQSYLFDWNSYNLMNFMEFASDRFAALTVHHNFNGFFFNKIPLVKKLQLREMGSFKVLYGSLQEQNRPTVANGLLPFPVDKAGNPFTRPFDARPYVEASVGLGNIFHFLRIDYVWRLSYRDLPGVNTWGVRASFQGGF